MVWLPLVVVTLIRPVIAPEGTTAVSFPNITPVGGAVWTPLNLTMGMPALKLAPVTVTELPTGPNPGEKPNTVGCTTKLTPENAEPAGVTTRTKPVVAPAGTTAEMFVLLRTV